MRLTPTMVSLATYPYPTSVQVGGDSVPNRRRHVLWDDDPRGLGLRVYPTGGRSWILEYRYRGRQRSMTLGRDCDLTLSQARALAKDKLAELRRGIDPVAEREIIHFDMLAQLYLERYAKVKKRSWREDERILRTNVLPHWKKRDVQEIKRRDVVALLDRIVDRGAPVMANRTKALLTKVFNFAVARGLMEYSPAYGVPTPAAEQSRSRVLSPEEVRAVWQACDRDGTVSALVLQLMLATMQRKGEIMSLRWDEVVGDTLVFGPERTKNGKPHVVPLGETAQEVLQKAEALGEGINRKSPWVFPSYKQPKRPLVSLNKAVARIAREAGIEHWTPHDLRRTAATMTTESGIPAADVGRLLNHAPSGVTAIYDRYEYAREKRIAMDRWDAVLQQALWGRETAKVLRLPAV